ncbi:MAG: TolC family protein, partial [Acidobacteria bacterium]|nr:TolC family protein [Acidobacteriota bacterium]
EVRQVGFEEAVERALEANPTVAEAVTAVRRSEARLGQARAATLPTLEASVSRSKLDEEIAFSELVAQPESQTMVSATAEVPVLAAADWARVGQGRDQVEVSRLSLAHVREQVASATARAYLGIITAKRQVEVEGHAWDNALAHLDYAETRFKDGAGSRLDVLRAAQLKSAQQARQESAYLALRQSQEALGVLLAENGPVDAAGEPQFEIPGEAEGSADLGSRPDFRLGVASLEAAERAVHDSWKDWVPEGTLAFTPQWFSPAGLFQQASSWRLSLSFTLPIYDGGQRRADAALRAVERDQAKSRLAAVEIEARSEVRIAREALASYDRALASTRQAAEQAEEVLKITTSAFELGAATSLEVIDAERSSRDAATAVAQAEDSVRRARFDLLVALGRFPKPATEPERTRTEELLSANRTP